MSAGGRAALVVVAVVTLAAVVIVALAGLNGAESSGPRGDNGTSVTEVRLSDGTRCAVMDQGRGSAIDCEWKP